MKTRNPTSVVSCLLAHQMEEDSRCLLRRTRNTDILSFCTPHVTWNYQCSDLHPPRSLVTCACRVSAPFEPKLNETFSYDDNSLFFSGVIAVTVVWPNIKLSLTDLVGHWSVHLLIAMVLKGHHRLCRCCETHYVALVSPQHFCTIGSCHPTGPERRRRTEP